jgi:cytochrome c oxidase subunit 3
MSAHAPSGGYYVPHGSYWPIVGSIALFLMAIGFGNYLHDMNNGLYLLLMGAALMLIMIVGWFGAVINESVNGYYNEQVDKSFRWGMGWFIFSEVMFFAAFFGALFYVRVFSLPWLGGAGAEATTQEFLWPYFDAIWPLIHPPGEAHSITRESFDVPTALVPAWGLPALNTAILLTSGVTITWAHWGLIKDNQKQFILGLLMTVLLGAIFLVIQAYEYGHAIQDLNLTLNSGVYGSLFYMLTGFHGLHVTLGAIILFVVLLRALKGHFSAHNHFAFEAAAWYWHFVDVVWLGLFIFVYWL